MGTDSPATREHRSRTLAQQISELNAGVSSRTVNIRMLCFHILSVHIREVECEMLRLAEASGGQCPEGHVEQGEARSNKPFPPH